MRRDLVAFVLLLLATSLLLQRGGTGGADIVLQLGPNDHTYLSGFVPHYETADGVAARWTTYDARIDLPLIAEGGPVTISFRFSRVFPETAEVEVRLDAATVDQFSCRGGEVVTRDVRLSAVSATPLVIDFDADSHERRNMGIRLDWVRVELGEHARVRLRGWPRWLLSVFAAFVFALFRWGGLSRNVSIGLAGSVVAGAFLWLGHDPFGLAHVTSRVAIPAMGLSALAAGVLRRFPGGRWVVPIFVLGYLLRAGGLFHPETFYPDVTNARDYVTVFRDTEGSLAERGVETQTRTNVGYPRTVGGKDYAFPYSPLYFLPFGLFSSDGAIEDAVRHGGLAAGSLAMLPLFWIAFTIFGARTAVVATFLWSFIPPIFSRLLLALHATVVGNLLDLIVIAAVVALALRPESRGRLALVGAATLVSFLVYTSSLFSMSAFLLCASILDRRLALKLLPIAFVSGVVTLGWLYWPFLIDFYREILPTLLAGGSTGPPQEPRALSRIPLFYGYLYPPLALVGFLAARKRAEPAAYRVLAAYALAFVLLLALRAFGAGVFKDLKEITFAAPLVSMLTAVSLDALANQKKVRAIAAFVLLTGLALFGLDRYGGYLEAYRSSVTSRPER